MKRNAVCVSNRKQNHNDQQQRREGSGAYTCIAPSCGCGPARWACRPPREPPETGRKAGVRRFAAACVPGGIEPPEELGPAGVASSCGVWWRRSARGRASTYSGLLVGAVAFTGDLGVLGACKEERADRGMPGVSFLVE